MLSKRKILVVGFLILSIICLKLLLSSSPPAQAQGQTIVVSPGESIQAAIDQTQDGDTVLVKAGVYLLEPIPVTDGEETDRGLLIENKNINLIGEGGERTILDGQNQVQFLVYFRNVNGESFSGFSFRGAVKKKAPRGYVFGNYLLIRDSNSLKVKNNIFANSNDAVGGVSVYNSSSIEIKNNLFSNLQEQSVWFSGGNGIIIMNNTVGNSRHSGVRIIDNSTAVAKNNIVFKNDEGFDCKDSQYTVLDYNDTWGNNDNYSGCAHPGSHSLDVNPLFVDEVAGDFHLQPGSSAIDSGDPTILDPDGSRSDMSAYGGPGACGLDPSLAGCVTPTVTLTLSPTPIPTPGPSCDLSMREYFDKADANCDGATDDLDYVLWWKAFGINNGGDFEPAGGDGDTDNADYEIWWENYGFEG